MVSLFQRDHLIFLFGDFINGVVKREHVQFNSEEYFNLLTKHPEAAPWLALGQNVVLTLDDTVYEITD